MEKISIITPCYNAEKHIKETVDSVINQTAILSQKVELEYIICDGQSNDETLRIIESIKSNSIKIISETDLGMYDALAKGLKLASGDIVAYLNAGDYYHKCAFDIVVEIFRTKKVKWLTGYEVAYNEKSHVVRFQLPYNYRKELICCGLYGTWLPFIQQESTFWSASLSSLIDYTYLSKLKYAGDFYIWLQFSKFHNLKIVEAYLGGFKYHKGQLSENIGAYHTEVQSMVNRPNIRNYLLACYDKLLWLAPNKIKKTFNNDGLLRFNHQLQEWM